MSTPCWFRALALVVYCTAVPFIAVASTTQGSIEPSRSFAWSENLGWINFHASQGNVVITDASLSGYVWSIAEGWINLAPTHGGVRNDAEGQLSGLAWGENIGWIDFSGVTIDRNGRFHGTASNETSGIITFDCGQCDVRTDWRPRSVRESGVPDSNAPPTVSVGGGSLPPEAFIPPKPPVGGFQVLVDNTSPPMTVYSRFVNLTFRVGSDVTRMAISTTKDFQHASLVDFAPVTVWDVCSLPGGLSQQDECLPGTYPIYVKFYTKYGLSTEALAATVFLRNLPVVPMPAPVPVEPSPPASITGLEGIGVFLHNLTPGRWHPDVKRLQQFLNAFGFKVADVGSGAPGHETKFYGPLTMRAVKKLQQTYAAQILYPYGIPYPTGWFYERTRAFVNAQLSR